MCVTQESGSTSSVPVQVPTLSFARQIVVGLLSPILNLASAGVKGGFGPWLNVQLLLFHRPKRQVFRAILEFLFSRVSVSCR